MCVCVFQDRQDNSQKERVHPLFSWQAASREYQAELISGFGPWLSQQTKRITFRIGWLSTEWDQMSKTLFLRGVPTKGAISVLGTDISSEKRDSLADRIGTENQDGQLQDFLGKSQRMGLLQNNCSRWTMRLVHGPFGSWAIQCTIFCAGLVNMVSKVD